MTRSLYVCTRQNIQAFNNTIRKEILVCTDLRTALKQLCNNVL